MRGRHRRADVAGGKQTRSGPWALGRPRANQAPYPSALDGESPEGPARGQPAASLASQGLFFDQHQQGEPDRVSDPGGRSPQGGSSPVRRRSRSATGGNAVPPRTVLARLCGRLLYGGRRPLLVLLERGARSVESLSSARCVSDAVGLSTPESYAQAVSGIELFRRLEQRIEG